jgi:intron-binding protein aquarius
VSLGFKYDTLLMEEAAQVLEIETFIPMLVPLPLLYCMCVSYSCE